MFGVQFMCSCENQKFDELIMLYWWTKQLKLGLAETKVGSDYNNVCAGPCILLLRFRQEHIQWCCGVCNLFLCIGTGEQQYAPLEKKNKIPDISYMNGLGLQVGRRQSYWWWWTGWYVYFSFQVGNMGSSNVQDI